MKLNKSHFCQQKIRRNPTSRYAFEFCMNNGANAKREPDKNTGHLYLSPDKCASYFFFDGKNMPLLFKTSTTEYIKSMYA